MLFRSHDACDDDDFVEDKASRTEFDSHDVTTIEHYYGNKFLILFSLFCLFNLFKREDKIIQCLNT